MAQEKTEIKPPEEQPTFQDIRCALCGTPEGLRIMPVMRFYAIVATVTICGPCYDEHDHLSVMFVDPYDVIKIKG